MVAGLLYVIGLISVLVTIALVGFSIPTTVNQVTAAIDAGNVNYVDLVRSVAISYTIYATPFIAGLMLMGFGRVIFLLGAINRSLRGQS